MIDDLERWDLFRKKYMLEECSHCYCQERIINEKHIKVCCMCGHRKSDENQQAGIH